MGEGVIRYPFRIHGIVLSSGHPKASLDVQSRFHTEQNTLLCQPSIEQQSVGSGVLHTECTIVQLLPLFLYPAYYKGEAFYGIVDLMAYKTVLSGQCQVQ